MNKQAEVAVYRRRIRFLGVNHEHADHPHHLLHGHMGVVEEGPVLMDGELVDELVSGLDEILGQARHSVHFERHFQAMPVHGEFFGQTVLDDESQTIPLIDFNQRPRHRTIETPHVDNLAWKKLAFHDLASNVKDLETVLQRPGHLGQIGHFDQRSTGSRLACGRRKPRRSFDCGLDRKL